MLLTTESAKAPIRALQIPARKRKPLTAAAAIPKAIAEIIKVINPDNKPNVSKFGIKNTALKIGFTIAAAIPSTAAEMYAFTGLSISTPSGSLVIINKLEALTSQAIKISTNIPKTPSA